MYNRRPLRRAGVAQLVESELPKLKVAGSIPVARSKTTPETFWNDGILRLLGGNASSAYTQRMNLLTVSSHEVLNLGGKGGEPFVDCVNRLLRAEATMAGCPTAAVTTLSVNERDGGVDARLDIARPSATGWFPTPTCWQIKSGPISPKKAAAEVNKWYVRELLTKGYTYRLCLRDELTPPRRENLDRVLLATAREIAPNTLPPRVLDAGDLANWYSQYPALVVAAFKPHLGNVLHFEAWSAVALACTASFVSDGRFEKVHAAIEQHVRFTETPPSAILTIGGAPGSGRMRLVFESVRRAGLESVVLYADSEPQVDALATLLANEMTTHAVLVAGNCSSAMRERLRDRLSGSRKRVRIIAIDPAESDRDRCDVWIDRAEADVVKQIVEANFASVDERRRRTYVELGSPNLSLIIDLISRASLAGDDGDLTRVIDPLSASLDVLLTAEERTALAAASLVGSLDIRAEAAALTPLARIAGTTEQQLRNTLESLSERERFTGDLNGLIRVEPPAVASVLFREAWRRWDGSGIIITALLSRAAKCHDPNIRTEIATRCEGWIYRVTSDDLKDADIVHRLLLLVEIDPSRYLSALVRLIESCSHEDLARMPSPFDVIHFCHKLAAFAEAFDGIERILFRLEQSCRNSGTFGWASLFATALSSTTVSFVQRLERVEKRILEAKTPQELDFAFRGLSMPFSNHYFQIEPEQYVGGRLRPLEPAPDGGQIREDKWAALEVLRRLASSNHEEIRSRALRLVLNKLWFFLNEGVLAEIRTVLNSDEITEEELQDALGNIRGFVRVYSSKTDAGYLDEVRAWIDELLPRTPERRIWEYFTRDQDADELQDDARAIAPDLLLDDIDFAKVQRIVDRGNAYRAVLLGDALGKVDSDARRLDEIVAAAKPAPGFSFYRGYVGALLVHHPHHADAVNALLDELESKSPEVCAEIALGGWRATRALERLTRLLEEDKVDPSRARDLSAVGEHALSAVEFAHVIDLLRSKIDRFPSAADTGLDMIWWRLHSKGNAEPVELEAFARFIDSATLLERDREIRHWGSAMEEMAKLDPETTIVLAAKGLGSLNDQVQFHAEKVLADLAKNAPQAVTNAVGRALLAQEGIGWHFLRLSGLYRALPLESVKAWLERAGFEGARALARHLPWPRLVDGQPIVHPLTAYVLGAFEEDDEVFKAFSRGPVVRSYSGDIAEEHEKEAERRRAFLNHPLKRIRDWAIDEVERAKYSAEVWRERKKKRLPARG